MKFATTVLACLASALLFSQEVTTLIPPATAPDFHSFEAISWSKDGRIYCPDFYRGKIYQINRDGTKITLQDSIRGPLGGAFDDAGNYYYSEFNLGNIYRLTPAGVDSLIGTGFGGPTGTMVDSTQTKLYVSDYNNDKVLVLDLSTGQRSELASGGGLDGLDGIVYAPNGDLLVASFENNKIHRVKADGTVSLFTELTDSPDSGYLIHFGDGYLSAGLNSNSIWHIDAVGTVTRWLGTGTAGATDGSAEIATFEDPNGIAINPAEDTILVTSGEFGVGMRMITGFGVTSTSNSTNVDQYSLQLSPNPASEVLTIEYRLGVSAKVQLTLLSPEGRLLGNIVDTTQTPGVQQLRFDIPGHLPAGQYRCLLKVNDQVTSKAFVLQR